MMNLGSSSSRGFGFKGEFTYLNRVEQEKENGTFDVITCRDCHNSCDVGIWLVHSVGTFCTMRRSTCLVEWRIQTVSQMQKSVNNSCARGNTRHELRT